MTTQRPETDPAIAFDDKRLVNKFKTVFHPGSATAVKRLVEEMLVARFLLDNLVIRTDSVRDTTDDDSNWSYAGHISPVFGRTRRSLRRPRSILQTRRGF